MSADRDNNGSVIVIARCMACYYVDPHHAPGCRLDPNDKRDPVTKHMFPSRDWLADFPHENGQYNHLCIECGCTFIGHKNRLVCRQCATAGA